MTALTLRAKRASVFIVFLMARRTSRRDDDVLVHRCCVAIIAPQSFVLSVKLEFCACVVIEVPNLPISKIVAVYTTDPQSSAMDVVAFVTGKAVDGSLVFVEGPFVATVAHHRTMLAE